MASQALNQFEGEAHTPFMLRDILPGPGWAPYQAPARALPRVVEYELDDSMEVEEGSCVKGMLSGILVEGIVALGVYAVWHAWHVIR
jgi:hypothetical protein